MLLAGAINLGLGLTMAVLSDFLMLGGFRKIGFYAGAMTAMSGVCLLVAAAALAMR